MTAQFLESIPVYVLIAEDDGVMRQSLCRLLEGEGYNCAQADNGPAAVEMARRFSPRCAILDLGMPGLDGFMVARQLRSDPITRDVRINCLTGRSDASSRAEAHDAGFETFLTKPFDPERILRLLREQVPRPKAVDAMGLGLTDAREMLDCLENAGCQNLEASYQDEKGFTVRGEPGAETP
jgi:CheY-like chemotaxis protein